MVLGHWKNFEELEESLTLDEMIAIRDASGRAEFQRQKFAAALKGVELDDPANGDAPTFDDIKRRAEAKVRGLSEEQVAFDDVGIMIIEE